MYVYDEYDQRIVEDRVKQFRDQTRRYLAGELTGEEFRPLRLQNGLYIQRYAPMLRIAVPYGLLSSRQLRKLAQIARDYDKGYAHISTRQNVQFNWPELEDVPEILAELERLAPLSVVRGNNDTQDWAADIPERLLLKIGRLTLYVLHDLKRLDLDPAAEGIDVVVAGHSHKPLKEERDGVLYLNPGSAGPRRFSLPIGIGVLEVAGKKIEAELITL